MKVRNLFSLWVWNFSSIPHALRRDLRNRSADPVTRSLAVGVHVIATRRVEICDIRSVADKDNPSGKLKRPLATVFSKLPDRTVRGDGDQRVALVSHNPKISATIKRQSIGAFE